ncbi:ABC transporter permease, partial [Candidatus Bathyarchaeota archaeon]|nr:ABC transporter permease [Candidatus Bathyarchaeota archaeon]
MGKRMWDSTLAFTSGYKMLIRKSGSAWFILTIALLVALLASTNAITNALSLQAETLAKLKNPEGTYILLSGNATALTDSKLDTTLTGKLGNLSCIQQILPQKIIQAHITAESSNATAQIIGVNNVAAYLKTRRASLNGSTAKNPTEANIGEILANTLSISLGNQISCTAHNRQVKIKIAGIFRSQTQSDTEIIVPLETANILAGDNKTITLIEFTLKKDANPQESLNQITQLLPENVKLIQTQQLKEFTQQI